MVRRRKRRGRGPRAAQDALESANSEIKAPPVGVGMGELLRRAGLSTIERPEPERAPARAPKSPPEAPAPSRPRPPARTAEQQAPRSPLSAGELAAWNEAYRGVAPIKRRRSTAPPVVVPRGATSAEREDDLAARQRLASLVADAIRFRVEWDGCWVTGARGGVDASAQLRRLGGAGFVAEAQLDLHGLHRAEVAHEIDRFVREQRRRGRRRVLLIVGKGNHSEGGKGVLADAAVEALTRAGAAPIVSAFASAHPTHGGTGAIAVLLR